MNARGNILPAKPNRTLFTTLLGVAAIMIGGLASIFSLFALLLALGKPYATGNETFTDIFLIFILPPGTLLAGFGLLFRHRWARLWMILLIAALITIGVQGFIPEKPPPSKYDYYATTDEARNSRNLWSGASIAIGALTLIGLFSKPVRNEFLRKSTTTPPPIPASLTTTPILAPATAATTPPSKQHKKHNLLFPIIIFLAMGIAAMWDAYNGLQSGKIRSIAKFQATRIHTIQEEPAQYWLSVSILGIIGIAATIMACAVIFFELRKKIKSKHS